MLKTFITHKNGDIYLNELRRYVLSGVLVPSFDNGTIKIPKASGGNPGASLPFTLEGPQDAHSLVMSLSGAQGLRKLGTGSVSAAAGLVNINGTDTKFTRELAPGDILVVVDDALNTQTATIDTVLSDTLATATVAFPAAVGAATPKAWAWSTPVVADVSNKMRVDITDVSWRRKLMNRPVPVQHIFGSAQKPFFLAEPILLERNQTLMFNFYNHSTAANGSFSLSGETRKFQIEALRKPEVAFELDQLYRRKIWYQPYWLTMDEDLSLPPTGYAVRYFTNTGDTALYLKNVYGYAVTAGASGDLQEKIVVELSDVRTGRTYQSAPVTLNNLCGTAEYPFELPCPLVVEPEGQIKATFRSLVTDAPVDVYMTFFGVAVLKQRGAIIARDITSESKVIFERDSNPELIESSVRA